MAFESIGGVLEGGAPVPVGGEPGDADSDEDSEGEDLHSVNVILVILLICWFESEVNNQ